VAVSAAERRSGIDRRIRNVGRLEGERRNGVDRRAAHGQHVAAREVVL
jgi:hypothetical protein